MPIKQVSYAPYHPELYWGGCVKTKCLLLGCALAAAIASAQEAPVHVTRVMMAGPDRPGLAAHVGARNVSTSPGEVAVHSALASVHSLSVPSGITYTCDLRIANLGAGICNALNTTIAGLYAAAFTNASARIYITLGSTGLGASDYLAYSLPYASFRDALQRSQTDGDDITALTASVPATEPIAGNPQVSLAGPNYRALGFAPGT